MKAEKSIENPIKELKKLTESLFRINFDIFQKLLEDFSTITVKKECQQSLTQIQERLTRLQNLFNQELGDIRIIKTTYKNLLEGIYNQAGSELVKITQNTLNQVERGIVHDLFSIIQETAKNTIKESQQLIDPRLFQETKEKESKKEAAYRKKLTLLVEESTRVRTTQKTKFDLFLTQLKAWLNESGVKQPGQLFISYAWADSESEEESWLQPFLTGVKEHLDLCGIVTHLDILSSEAREGIFGYMHKKIDASNFILLIGTENLYNKHFFIGMLHEELSELRRMREADLRAGKQPGVIPVNLSKNHRDAFPPGFEGYCNIRDWPSSDYLLNLQEIIGYIYGVYENKAYQGMWSSFHDQLAQHDYVLRRSPQDRRLPLIPGNPKETFPAEKLRYDPAQRLDGVLIAGMTYQPKLIPHFVERNLLSELPEKYDSGINPLILTGLGGAGKSQLATYYFYRSTVPYDFRIWFRAEENLDEQYLQFAKSAGIVDASTKLSIADLRSTVHEWLIKKNTGLIIFDNVANFSDIENFIPQPTNKLHIVITSRNRLYAEMNCIDVGLLDKKEAKNLLTHVLGNSHEDSQIENLIFHVGSLALALSQAAYFILHHTLSIQDYITLYQKNLALVLSYEDPRACPAEQHRPAWVSFNLIFDQLLQENPLSSVLLQYMSYLASDIIPEELIMHLIANHLPDEKNPHLKLLLCKKIFNQYSIVKYDPHLKLFSLHRLVQAIIREKTQHLKEDNDFLLSAQQVFKNLYTSLIWFRKKSNPEFTELEAHQFEARQNEHCLKLVEYDRAVPTTEADVMPTDPLRLETLFFIAGFYLSAHQFDLSIIYHEKAFALRQLIPIKDDPRKAAMEPRGLGLAYAHSGQSEKALAVFNRILESRDILDPHDVCIVMSNSGLAYNCQKTKMNEDVTFQNAAIANYQLVIQTYRDTTRQEILDIPGLSHYQEIYACQLLGGIYLIQKRLDDAINIYQHGLWRIMIHYAMRGLKLETFDHLEDHCRTTLYALGKCYQDKQELGIAYACFTQSLKLLQGSTEKKLADRCEEFIRALEPKVIGTLPFADGILSLAKPDPDTLKRLKRQGIFYLNHTFHRSKTEEVLLKLTGIVPKS